MTNKDILRDSYATHTITNYLYSSYQGRFSFLNILSQLNFPNLNQALFAETRDAIDKIAHWTEQLWQGEALFSASWNLAQTFQSTKALELLEGVKPELYVIANELVRIFSAGTDFTNRTDDLRLLAACFGRFAYSREHYIQGFLLFGQKFNSLEEIERYSPLLPAAQEDIKVTHLILKALQTPEKLDGQFSAALVERCIGLPATFRTHAHDINQLLAQYRGGLTFENAEFSPEEATAWKEINVNAVIGGYWRANGFTAAETKSWVAAGLTNPSQCFEWRLFQFSPTEAADWFNQQIPPVLAISWAQAGYLPKQAREYLEKGITDPAKVE